MQGADNEGENEDRDAEVKDDHDIVGAAEEELKSPEMKTDAKLGDVAAEVRHKSSIHLTVKIDAKDGAEDAAASRRGSGRQSRDFAADETRTSRTSSAKDAKDAEDKISDSKFEVESKMSGQSSNESAAPRYMYICNNS